MSQIQKYADVTSLVNEKLNVFTDTMVEDIQDIVKVEFPEVKGFFWGVLPPEYVEAQNKMKQIIADYIHQNIVYNTDDTLIGDEFIIY